MKDLIVKIAIDCQAIQTNSRNRGIGRYSLDLINHLIDIDFSIEITLLINLRLSQDFRKEISLMNRNNVQIRMWSPLENSNWSTGNLARQKLSEVLYQEVVNSINADVYLLLSPFEGFDDDSLWSTPSETYNIAIYYDAIPRIYKERYLGNKQLLKWYSNIESKIAKFDKILAISHDAGANAEKFLQLDHSTIDTIFFGVDKKSYEPSPTFNEIKEEFVLAVLGEDERKNKINLVKAWDVVHKKLPDLKLKIVYKQSEPEKMSNNKILKNANLGSSVEFLDFITDEKLYKLYNECKFTVFPSFYEGLGLPILESFLFRKACLTSDSSSMKELVRLTELKFDPNKPTEIANKIINLFANDRLQEQAITDGQTILEQFSSTNKKNQLTNLFVDIKKREKIKKKNELNNQIMGVYFHTILKPTESGIADFAENLIHPLHVLTNLVIVNDNPEGSINFCPICSEAIKVLSVSTFHDSYLKDYINIHNIGNSEFHIWQVKILAQYPGLTIMHDGYLSGLMRVTLERSIDARAFLTYAIQETSALNFIDPLIYMEPHLLVLNEKMTEYILESTSSIIVHNNQAKEMINRDYAIGEIASLNIVHPPLKAAKKRNPESITQNVIGIFGIIHETKMYEEIINSWKLSKTGRSGKYILRFIGKDLSSNFKNIYGEYSRKFNIECVGYVNENEYWSEIESVKLAIQMRRDVRGESSGAVIDLISCEVPIISNMLFGMDVFPIDLINPISIDFSSIELADKIDWVLENFDIAFEKSKIGREILGVELSPFKYTIRMLEIAQKTQLKNDFFPVTQLRRITSMLEKHEQAELKADELALICLESFPPIFKKIRVIVLLKELTALESSRFKKVLIKLKSQLSQITHLPIFFCKTINVYGHIETVNRIFFDNIYMDLLDNAEFKIRIQDSDIVFGSRSIVSSLNFDPSLVTLINSELGDFLESTD